METQPNASDGEGGLSFEKESPLATALFTPPQRGQKIETWQWVSMTSFQLVYSFVNAGFGLFVLPIEAERLNQDNASIWLGFYLCLCGSTQLICPIAGKLSDRHESQYGKRRPYIAWGTLGAIIAMALMWLASVKTWPVIYTVGLFFCQLSLNVIYSAQCGLPADIQENDEEENRDSSAKGIVSGVIAVHSFLGSLLAMAIIIVTRHQPVQALYPVYLIGLAVCCAVIFFSVREAPTNMRAQPLTPLTMGDIRRSYLIDIEADRDFLWVCIGRMFYYISTSVVVFLYYYIRDMIHIQEESELKTRLGMLAIGAQLVGVASAIPCSHASNKCGRKPVIYASCAVMICTFVLYIVAPKVGPNGSWPLVLTAGLVYGLGTGAYLSVDYALALDCLPATKTTAEAFGLWGVAGFIGSTIGPMVGGCLLFMCNNDQVMLAMGLGPVEIGNTVAAGGDYIGSYTYLGYSMVMVVDGILMTLMVVFVTSKIMKVK